ncbi:hypothetical protein ABFS83_14G317300 [Erythranthe nasuta]
MEGCDSPSEPRKTSNSQRHNWEAQNPVAYDVNNKTQMNMIDRNQIRDSTASQDWDPKVMLHNLSFLEKKIHHLQHLVHSLVAQITGRPDNLLVQQQQLITADLTSIIVQLISTAGTLLPSVKHTTLLSDIPITHFEQSNGLTNLSNEAGLSDKYGTEQICTVEDHGMKSDDDGDVGENLPPGSYEILQLEKEEILAPHTHFCTICGKGFKRDANLRMHMRGHGDEYKTAAALAKPTKEYTSDPVIVKRYSCPYLGCKRNKDHKKFQALKSILCVKNHYKRTHCDKIYTCTRCNTKKFSVVADLKTHEKHCGQDKWLCSCGTTFSRKDKLFGHITLFQGHTPAIPVGEASSSKVEQVEFDYEQSTVASINEFQNVKGSGEDDAMNYFSPSSFGISSTSIGGFHEFPRNSFNDEPESSNSFMLSGSCDYFPKYGSYNGTNNVE